MHTDDISGLVHCFHMVTRKSLREREKNNNTINKITGLHFLCYDLILRWSLILADDIVYFYFIFLSYSSTNHFVLKLTHPMQIWSSHNINSAHGTLFRVYILWGNNAKTLLPRLIFFSRDFRYHFHKIILSSIILGIIIIYARFRK